MRFAHLSQVFHREGESAAERYEQLWREIRLCDEVGFDYAFASIHHFSHLRPQATVFCTGAAACTSRIRVGPMGYTAALYDPMRVVEEVLVLDNATNGRLDVGITAGVTRDEFRIYRADWDNRFDAAYETLRLLKKAFGSEKPFDFDGKRHRYEDVHLSVEPLQSPHPPLWLISVSPESLELAAREGAHTGYLYFRPPHEAAPLLQDYLRMWRRHEHPHMPNIIFLAFTYVDESDEAAIEKGLPHILHSTDAIYGGELGGGGTSVARIHEARGEHAMAEIRHNMYDMEYLLERDLIFVGSPDTVARKIGKAAREGMFNVFAGEFNIGALEEDDLMRSIRLFGQEVIPALSDLDPPRDYLGQLGSGGPAAASSP